MHALVEIKRLSQKLKEIINFVVRVYMSSWTFMAVVFQS
jgi:hypothetical protein